MFKLQKKPTKPKRKTEIQDKFNVYIVGVIELDKLKDNLLDQVKTQLQSQYRYDKNNITLESYDSFTLKEESGWDDVTLYIIGTRKETDKEFKVRMDAYNLRFKEYSAWQKNNKDKIEAELQRRADVEKARLKSQKTKREKEIAKLEAKLAKLKKS